jgi:hypothetical protein
VVVVGGLVVAVDHHEAVLKSLIKYSLKELETNVNVLVNPLPALDVEDLGTVHIKTKFRKAESQPLELALGLRLCPPGIVKQKHLKWLLIDGYRGLVGQLGFDL